MAIPKDAPKLPSDGAIEPRLILDNETRNSERDLGPKARPYVYVERVGDGRREVVRWARLARDQAHVPVIAPQSSQLLRSRVPVVAFDHDGDAASSQPRPR